MNLNKCKRYQNREIWLYTNDEANSDIESVFIPKGTKDKRKFKSKTMRFGKKRVREIIVVSKLPQGQVPRSFTLHVIFKDGTEEKIRITDGELIGNFKN